MGLDYSQRQLLNQPLAGRRSRRLQWYAVITGFFSMLISFATLIIWILK